MNRLSDTKRDRVMARRHGTRYGGFVLIGKGHMMPIFERQPANQDTRQGNSIRGLLYD